MPADALKKGSHKKKATKVVDWEKFRKGRARCKGRTKAEKRAERHYARMWRASASLRADVKVRMLLAQMGATTATAAQVVRQATRLLDTMSDALVVYDQSAAAGGSQGQVGALLITITHAAKEQAPQFGETARKTLAVPWAFAGGEHKSKSGW